MESKDLKKLLDQYLHGTIDASDIDRLFDTLRQQEHKEEWLQLIEGLLHNEAVHGLSGKPGPEQVLQTILAENSGQVKPAGNTGTPVIPIRQPARFRRRWFLYAAAACVVLVFSAGIYQVLPGFRKPRKEVAVNAPPRFKNDVLPGTNKAVLTLANGSTIILDSTATGTLTREGNTSLVKTGDGQLAYNQLTETPSTVLYNMISTPRGGQYQLVLADGTKVWLNASSTLRFPASFTPGERVVQLNGEAYFEVARLTAKDGQTRIPFRVQVVPAVSAQPAEASFGGMTVEVLGTHFNINAYNDEAEIKTTLLEGSVKVVKAGKTVTIRPGEQAQLNKNNEINVFNNPDIEEVMAWKNGAFRLKAAGIQAIMRQVARWYDVEVGYEGGEIKQTFYGTIPRNVSAINLFKVLEETGGVHFRIEGKKVTVLP